MSDLISRDEAIKAIKKRMGNKPLPPTEIYTYFGCIDEIKALPSAEAMSRESYINAVCYVEWLEKLIVDSETFEWLCEDTNDEKWCVENCNYSSIQAECLRHLYEVSKGGDDE